MASSEEQTREDQGDAARDWEQLLERVVLPLLLRGGESRALPHAERLAWFRTYRAASQLVLQLSPRTHLTLDCWDNSSEARASRNTAMRLASQSPSVALTMLWVLVAPPPCLLPRITSLTLKDVQKLSADTLGGLPLPALKELTLRLCTFTDALTHDSDEQQPTQLLAVISLECTGCNQISTAASTALSVVDRARLTCLTIDENVWEHVASLPALTFLDATGHIITLWDEDFQCLTNHPSLEEVRLDSLELSEPFELMRPWRELRCSRGASLTTLAMLPLGGPEGIQRFVVQEGVRVLGDGYDLGDEREFSSLLSWLGECQAQGTLVFKGVPCTHVLQGLAVRAFTFHFNTHFDDDDDVDDALAQRLIKMCISSLEGALIFKSMRITPGVLSCLAALLPRITALSFERCPGLPPLGDLWAQLPAHITHFIVDADCTIPAVLYTRRL